VTTQAAMPLRELILAALAEAFLTRRAQTVFCADCTPGHLCPDHQEDTEAADAYEAAYTQVAMGSAQWCDLSVTLAAVLN
jgi:hypothetical protein